MVDRVCKKYIKIRKHESNNIIREVYCNMANIYLRIVLANCVRNSFKGVVYHG